MVASVLFVLTLMAAPSSHEAEVLQRVAAFGKAFERADAGALASMLTSSYTHTNGGSAPVDRDRWLQYVRDRAGQLQSGVLRITRYENSDVKVTLVGGTAIVTGLNVTEGVRREGGPFGVKLRFTQTWVLAGNQWLRAAFHDAPVKE
jgi:hypothetical protein